MSMRSPSEGKLQSAIHPLTLRFVSRPLEQAYQAHLNEESLPLVRLVLVAAVFNITVFYPSDRALFPQGYELIWLLRTTLMLPAVILTFVLTFWSNFYKYRAPFIWLAVSASGWVMPFGVFWYGPSGVMYFALGTIMIATFGLLMLGLPFVFSILTTWSFVLAVSGAIAYVVTDLSVAVTIIQLLIISCTILTVAAYRFENFSRRLFYRSRQLIAEQERLVQSEASGSHRWQASSDTSSEIRSSAYKHLWNF